MISETVCSYVSPVTNVLSALVIPGCVVPDAAGGAGGVVPLAVSFFSASSSLGFSSLGFSSGFGSAATGAGVGAAAASAAGAGLLSVAADFFGLKQNIKRHCTHTINCCLSEGS